MAWYLRKALSFGPLRLNLSKGGLGASFGVKGLRVGMDARGREYIAGGRQGLYFKKYAKGTPAAPDARAETEETPLERELDEPVRMGAFGWIVLIAILVAIAGGVFIVTAGLWP